MANRRLCSLCGATMQTLVAANVSTHYCTNCDQYPWMIQPMTEKEVMEQNRQATIAVERYRG